MSLSFAALLFRPDQVSDRALAHGFAVALAGWDVPAPVLSIASLRSVPGWSAAFYESGSIRAGATADDELEHAWELFEGEEPPGRSVLHQAVGSDRKVYAILYSDDLLLDDAWRFDDAGFLRHFVRDDEDVIEIGTETPDDAEIRTIEIPDENEPLETHVRPHRGSTFLTAELRAAALPALAAAYFDADRRLPIRLFEADPASVAREARSLNAVLSRQDGRGAFEAPPLEGACAPPEVQAFTQTYDFSDPTDPEDLYREVAIGGITGTLRFSRLAEIAETTADPTWGVRAGRGVYPIARLHPSALGGAARAGGVVALAADRDHLVIVDPEGSARRAGPTLTELLRYLALGFKSRDAFEEELIQALMMKAHLRAAQGEADPDASG